MKRIRKRTIFAFAICIAWLLVIFAFSDMNAQSSTSITNKALVVLDYIRNNNAFINNIFNKLTENYPIFFIIRKMAHMFVFCVLQMISFTVLRVTKKSFKKSAVLSILIVFGYACLDEFHQLFVDGRSGQFSDVIIDTMGGLIGLCTVSIVSFFVYIWKKHKKSILS